MSETEPSETKPKKMVSRSVAIGLGIVCIILVVGLAGTIANYTSIINGKDNTISTLNSQVSDLNSTLNGHKSTVWVNNQTVSQSSNSSTAWTFAADYAGWVVVDVQSTIPETYVKLVYNTLGVHYQNTVDVGWRDIAVFPVLHTDKIDIYVGNSNILNGATETVTITYYY